MHIEKLTLIFVQKISGIDYKLITNIPEDVLSFITCLTIEEIATPIVTQEFRKGRSIGEIEIFTGLPKSKIREIGRKKGFCSKYPSPSKRGIPAK